MFSCLANFTSQPPCRYPSNSQMICNCLKMISVLPYTAKWGVQIAGMILGHTLISCPSSSGAAPQQNSGDSASESWSSPQPCGSRSCLL
ncbi:MULTISPECIES: DUF6783 domain-containing protein [Blautia]|uniref:DUF6783 domain-containing protein n=1 Tax=Blautia TaxID=572511 RepID=UPI0038CC1840